ncbi:four-carbon acid sugar kinase family protein [Fontivita pretiosa]|uniref:four-carbon acid sugar kinase family protein n=1 Tax=Fontivita pretiosa TaxID=2989684 RepID=UPI003D17026C
MQRALVIADDLSGAAEIAGLGHRYGLSARLARAPGGAPASPGLSVFDTDSRALPAESAAQCVRSLLRHLADEPFDLIYKKTDSVLRGPVRAEIEAVMEVFNRRAALLVAANPSRGRTIRQGVYRIDGVPLDQTPFADDPDHPARSSHVLELLAKHGTQRLHIADPNACATLEPGITLGDAGSAEDVDRWASLLDQQVLPCGGADFFQAILRQRGLGPVRPFLDRMQGDTRLFVCGSASAYSRQLAHIAERHSVQVLPMPDDTGVWIGQVRAALERTERAMINIARPIDRSPGASLRYQEALAEVVEAVLQRSRIDLIFLEGGATASAVCRRLGWDTFAIVGELATGVVAMQPQRPQAPGIVVKPGSYPWPDAVWRG